MSRWVRAGDAKSLGILVKGLEGDVEIIYRAVLPADDVVASLGSDCGNWDEV